MITTDKPKEIKIIRLLGIGLCLDKETNEYKAGLCLHIK